MGNGNNTHRKKDSAKLVWDTKPRRAPNPKDIEFQTAEAVIPNPQYADQNVGEKEANHCGAGGGHIW